MLKAFRRVSNPTLSISPGKQETQSGIILTTSDVAAQYLRESREKSGNHLLANPSTCYYKYVYIILDKSCCLVWGSPIYSHYSSCFYLPSHIVTPTWSVLFDSECTDLQVLMSWQLADASLMPCKCYSAYILVQFMCVHVCSCNTCTCGEPCREHSPLVAHSYVDVPNSY
jgi:hypothetical protein